MRLPQHASFPPEFERGPDRRAPGARPETRRRAGAAASAARSPGNSRACPRRMHNCHCSRCRRARSAAHATNAFFKREQLTWLRGEQDVDELQAPRREALRPGFLPALRHARPARRRLDGLCRRPLRRSRRRARHSRDQPHLRRPTRRPGSTSRTASGSGSNSLRRPALALAVLLAWRGLRPLRHARRTRSANSSQAPRPRPRRAMPPSCAASSPTTTRTRAAAMRPTSAISCTPGSSRIRP